MLALLFRLLVPEAMMFGPHRLGVGGTVWVRGCGGACALCVPLSLRRSFGDDYLQSAFVTVRANRPPPLGEAWCPSTRRASLRIIAIAY